MRALCVAAVAVAAFGLTGCGDGDPAQQRITALNAMSMALESGDMAKIRAAGEKMKAATRRIADTDHAEQMRLMVKHVEGLQAASTKFDAALEAAEAKMTDEQKKELKAILAGTKE